MTKSMAIILFLLMILLSDVAASMFDKCHQDDKIALLQIKKEFNNPTLLSSWKPDTDCCQDSWYGVYCSFSNGRVDLLLISNDTDLVSQFPPSIGNLRYLDTLSLTHLPNLTGPIPIKPMSKLSKLRDFVISSTGMSGPIPNFTTQMRKLRFLDFSSNNFYGTLPLSLPQLPKIKTIYFNNNSLTGPIPPSYSKFLGLVLSYNQLSGTLPASLASLNLINVQLSGNRFEGDASMLFGPNKNAVTIDISWNSFAFDMGRVELSKHLTTLDVSHNKIYGKLPVGIENVLNLNVSYNRLCGEIPKVGNLQSFDVYTYFHNKCLCGSPLPSCK